MNNEDQEKLRDIEKRLHTYRSQNRRALDYFEDVHSLLDIVARLRAENAELKARLDKYETDTSTWVVHAQRPGFPQPPAGGDDEQPVAGTA